MPSAKRFAFLRETVRNHPVVIATTAATAGVLLGGFVVVQVFAPPKPHTDNAGSVQAAAATDAAPKAPTETTGSAPPADSLAAANCDLQTWPHLSRVCMEEYRNKNRGPRVVSTDNLDKPETTAPQASVTDESKLAAPALWAPSVASPAPLATPPVTTASAPPPQAADPAPSAAVAPAPVAVPTEVPAQAAAANTEPKEKPVAKKSKRKQPKIPAKQKLNDDDDATFANNNSDDDDRASDNRAERRPDRSRRSAERWIERDYDVPDARGGGRRQVTVIRRGGGGLFENLFGMGRDRDDGD
jgi:hypothetical protein